MSSRSALAIALAPWLLLAACSDDGTDDGDDDGAGSEPDAAPEPEPDASAQPGETGMLFVLGNQAEGSEIFTLARDQDGALSEVGSYATGGLGSGEGLGSQGAIAVSDDGEHVFAVNAGSDEVSSLRVYPDHLALVDVVDSGGARPISLAARADRLYVLNADGAGSVSGFAVADGALTAIDGATRPLSTTEGETDPAQVALSPDGDLLIVTEKGTSRLTTYAVAADGSLGEPVVTGSSGQVPFGFAVTPSGVLVVSEAGGGPDGTSAVSSYAPQAGGTLATISGSVPSGQLAACWIALARDARYAYVTNAQSNSISGYQVGEDGGLTLFDDEGVTAALGEGHSPIDMVVAGDDAFLYTVAGGADVVVGMRIEEDGRLIRLSGDAPLPATAVGIAGF
jgi:6-phosphogluconolactonase (cycloisomerase 2 family)